MIKRKRLSLDIDTKDLFEPMEVTGGRIGEATVGVEKEACPSSGMGGNFPVIQGLDDSDVDEPVVVKDQGNRLRTTVVREMTPQRVKSRVKQASRPSFHTDEDIVLELPTGDQSVFQSVDTARVMGRAALLPRDKEKVSGMSSRSLLDSVFQLSIQGTYFLHELARRYELLEYQAESDRTKVAMLEEQLKEARSENASLKKEVIEAETRASGLQEDLAKAKRENVEIEEQGKNVEIEEQGKNVEIEEQVKNVEIEEQVKNAACDHYSEIPYKVKRKYVRKKNIEIPCKVKRKRVRKHIPCKVKRKYVRKMIDRSPNSKYQGPNIQGKFIDGADSSDVAETLLYFNSFHV